MRVKKHPNKNEYLLTDTGIWVRNFTRPAVPSVDINKLTDDKDFPLLLKNEILNSKSRYPWVDGESFRHDKVVVVSDGYRFKEVQAIVADLPKDIAIITVNGALAQWTSRQRTPTYYVVNNPYPESLHLLPKTIFPRCIASTRTYHEFLERYRGIKYRYMPVPDESYTGPKNNEVNYQVDDYRNPICAALNIAFRFGATKIVLASCVDCFESERPGAEAVAGGLYAYPQQRIAQTLIEANLFWMRRSSPGLAIRNSSDGLEYKLAPYIRPEHIREFFEEGPNG